MKKAARVFSFVATALLLLVAGQTLWAGQMMEDGMTTHNKGHMMSEIMTPKMEDKMSTPMNSHDTKKMMVESNTTEKAHMMSDQMEKSDESPMMDTMKKEM